MIRALWIENLRSEGPFRLLIVVAGMAGAILFSLFMLTGDYGVREFVIFILVVFAAAFVLIPSERIPQYRHKPAPCIKHRLGDQAEVCKNS